MSTQQKKSVVLIEFSPNPLPRNYERLLNHGIQNVSNDRTNDNKSTQNNMNHINNSEISNAKESQKHRMKQNKVTNESNTEHSLDNDIIQEDNKRLHPAQSSSSSKPSFITLKSPSYEMDLTLIMEMFLNGILDSFSLSKVFVSIVASKTLRMLLLKHFLINAVFCFITLAWYYRVISPFQSWISGLAGGRNDVFDFIFGFLNQVFWIYPLYITSLVMNSSSTSQIVNTTFHVKHKRYLGTVKTYRSLLMSFAQELYRLILFTILFLQIYIVQYIPVIGKLVSFCIFSYYISFLSFEHLWTLQGLSTEQQLTRFQEKYAYFLGFGLVWTFIVYLSPFILDQYFMNVFVSFLSIMTVHANILPGRNHFVDFQLKWIPKRLPVFGVSIYVTNKLIQKYYRRKEKKQVKETRTDETKRQE